MNNKGDFYGSLQRMRQKSSTLGYPQVNPVDDGSDVGQEVSAFAYLNQDQTTSAKEFIKEEQAQAQAQEQEPQWYDHLFGFIDETAAKFGAGFVKGWEGILDIGANALGWLTDLFGGDGSVFTDWAKQDIGTALAEWTKTYQNATPWGIVKNISNGNFANENYWKDMWSGAQDIFGSAFFASTELGDYRKDSDKYYGFYDQYDTGFGEFVGGLAGSIGEMLPSIMIGNAVGGAGAVKSLGSAGAKLTKGISLGTFGLAAAGNSAEEALNDGASSGEALGYGLVKGGIEVASEMLVGKALNGIASKVGLDKVIGKFGGNLNGFKFGSEVFKQASKKGAAVELVKSMFEEGAEEVFADIFAPFAESIYKKDALEQFTTEDYWKNVGTSFLSGAAMGGLTSGIGEYQSTKNYTAEGKYILSTLQEVNDLKEKYNKYKRSGLTSEEAYAKLGINAEEFSNKIAKLFENAENLEKNNPDKFENVIRAIYEIETNDTQDYHNAVDTFKKSLKTDLGQNYLNNLQSEVSSKYGFEYDSQYVSDEAFTNPTLFEKETGIKLSEKQIEQLQKAKNTESLKIGNKIYFAKSQENNINRLFFHEVVGHTILDSNSKVRTELIDSLRKSSEEFNDLWKQTEEYVKKSYKNLGANKNQDLLNSETLAHVLEKTMNMPKFYSDMKYAGLSKLSKFIGKMIDSLSRENSDGNKKLLSKLEKFVNKEIDTALNEGAKTLRKVREISEKAKKVKLKTSYNPALAFKQGRDFDSEGTALSKDQAEYFKNSKLRDDDGNLLVMFHGSPNAGFTVFDSKYHSNFNGTESSGEIHDGRDVNWFTSDSDVAKTYVTDLPNGSKLENISTIQEFKDYIADLFEKEGFAEEDGYSYKVKDFWFKNISGKQFDSDFQEQYELNLNSRRKAFDTSIVKKQGYKKGIRFVYEYDDYDGEHRIDVYDYVNLEQAKNGLYEIFGEQDPDLFEDDYIDDYEAGEVLYQVYLNIERPLIVDAQNANWDKISFEEASDYKAVEDEDFVNGVDLLSKKDFEYLEEQGLGEKAGFAENSTIEEKKKLLKEYLGKRGWRNTWSLPTDSKLTGKNLSTTRSIVDYAVKQGDKYDGVIIKNVKDNGGASGFAQSGIYSTVAITIESANQIKDTNNLHPTEDDDIKFKQGDNIDYETTNDQRFLQSVEEEARRQFDRPIEQRTSLEDNENLRKRLARIFQGWLVDRGIDSRDAKPLYLKSPTGNTFKVYQNVDGETFYKIFKIVRPFIDHGEFVDVHQVKSTNESGIGYDETINYLSDDGLSGFAITPEKDLISVFNGSDKRGWLRAVAPLVKKEVKTLDCYASSTFNLSGIYKRTFGFKTASLMEWNPLYDRDNVGKNYHNPDVAFMVNTDEEVETKHFGKDEYEEAVTYRNEFIKFKQGYDETVEKYRQNPRLDDFGSVKLTDDRVVGLTHDYADVLEDILVESWDYESNMLESADGYESYISKRYVNRVNHKCDLLLNRLSEIFGGETYLDNFSDYENLDYDRFSKLEEVLKDFDTENLDNITQEIDNLEEEPQSIADVGNRISELADFINDFNEYKEDIKQGYVDFKEKELLSKLDEDHIAKLNKINENKYLKGVALWEKADYVDNDLVDIIYEYMNARNEGGEYPSYERISNTKAFKDAQEYILEHKNDLTAWSEELFNTVVQESYDLVTEGKVPAQSGEQPVMFLVTGLPGAGKSTTGANKLVKEKGYVENDNDIFKEVPSLAKWYDGGIGANTIQTIVGSAQEKVTEKLMENRYNMVIPSLGKKLKTYAKFINYARKYGYKVIWRHTSATGRMSINSAFIRYLQVGRYVSPKFIYEECLFENETAESPIDKLAKEIYDNKGEFEYEGRKYQIDDYNGAVRSSESETRERGVGSTLQGNRETTQGRPQGHESNAREILESGETSARNAESSALSRLEKYKSFENTKDIVYSVKNSIENSLGTGYKISFEQNINNFIGVRFTELNTYKKLSTQTEKLYQAFLGAKVELEMPSGGFVNLGSIASFLSDGEKIGFKAKIEDILRESPDTAYKESKKLTVQLDRAVNLAKEYKDRLKPIRQIQKLIDTSKRKFDTLFELNADGVSRDGLYAFTQPFRNLMPHNQGYSAQQFKSDINKILSLYNEQITVNGHTMSFQEAYPNLPYDELLRETLVELYDSLGDDAIRKFTDSRGRVGYANFVGSLSSQSLELSVKAFRMITHLANKSFQKFNEDILPNAINTYEVVKNSDYGKSKNGIAKLFRGFKRAAAPAYTVIRSIFGGNSALAKLMTTDYQNAQNDLTFYKGGYNDVINTLLKKHNLKKEISFKKVTINNIELPLDEALFLYNLLSVDANKLAFDESGARYVDKNGNSKVFAGKNCADQIFEELNNKLTSSEKAYASDLLSLLNSGIKKDYITWFGERYGEYNHRNEIGEIGANTYWMMPREYQFMSSLENAVKSPAAVFKNAISRKNAHNELRIGSATSSVLGYINALAKEMYYKPIYREIISTLNAKVSETGDKNLVALIKGKLDRQDYTYLDNTLKDMLGIRENTNNDLLSSIMSKFSVAKLSLNIGTMLKQFTSIYTSNIPLRKSTKALLIRIFNSEARREFAELVDDIGGLKYRENNKVTMMSNIGESRGTKFDKFAEQVAKVGMYGIAKVDLFTISTGVYSLMVIAQDQYGHKIGTQKNKDFVKENWAEFELSQIGSGALSKNAIARNDYDSLTRALFGFMQGATRAALGSQLNKISLWNRNHNKNWNEVKNAVSLAEQKLNEFKESAGNNINEYDDEQLKTYHNLVSSVTTAKLNFEDYRNFKTAGGKSIPIQTAAGLVVQGLFITLLNELLRHLRGKKDWDEWDIAELGTDLSLNTLISWIPIVNTLSNLFQGYDISVPAADFLNEFGDLVDNIKNQDWKRAISTIAVSLGDMTGIPVKTIYEYLYGTVKMFNPEAAYNMNNLFYNQSLQSASKTLNSYRDKGNENGVSAFMNIIMNNYKIGGSEKTVNELSYLYMKGYNVLPKSSLTQYENGDEVISLTKSEKDNFDNYYKEVRKNIEDMISSESYKSLDDELKAKCIKKLYDSYYDYAKSKTLGATPSSKMSALIAHSQSKINLGKYLPYSMKIAQIEANKTQSRKDLVLKYINKLRSLSKQEKLLLLWLNGYGLTSKNKSSLGNFLIRNGMSKKTVKEILSQ